MRPSLNPQRLVLNPYREAVTGTLFTSSFSYFSCCNYWLTLKLLYDISSDSKQAVGVKWGQLIQIQVMTIDGADLVGDGIHLLIKCVL